MSKIFSVGLLGLGRVGARDDFVRKKFCRTHLLTILKNNNLKLKFKFILLYYDFTRKT